MAVRVGAVKSVLFLAVIDIPCLFLLLINTVCLLRLPAILSALLTSSSFYTEYPLVLLIETANLVVDLAFISLGLVLFVFRPFAVVTNLLEDEDHRRSRELIKMMGPVRYVLGKEGECNEKLKEVLNMLVKSYSVTDNAHSKFLLASVVSDYLTDLEVIRVKLMDKYVDDRFIYLFSKYIFLKDKHAHFKYRRFLLERIYLRNPTFRVKERNMELHKAEYLVYKTEMANLRREILEFEVEQVPLYRDGVGFFKRSRKENQVIMAQTLKEGYFATILLILLNCVLIYRAPSFLRLIARDPYLVRKKAIVNLREYRLDLLCVCNVLVVMASIYRAPDLISDLVVDIFYKRSLRAVRATAAIYPPKIKRDLGKALSHVVRWKTIAFFLASLLCFCFIPLSAVVRAVKSTGLRSQTKLLWYSLLVYVVIALAPYGILHEAGKSIIDTRLHMLEYFGVITAILVVLTVLMSGKPRPLPPVDYVRKNWGLALVIFNEISQAGQMLAMLLPSSWLRPVFLFDTGSPAGNLNRFTWLFYLWFIVSSAPVVLEGILKYVPEGRFSKDNFSWQFFLTIFGGTLFIPINFLACSYLGGTVEGRPMWEEGMSEVWWCMIFLVWYLLTSISAYCTYCSTTDRSIADLKYSPIFASANNLIKLAPVLLLSFTNLPFLIKVTIVITSCVLMFVLPGVYTSLVAQYSSQPNQKACNSKILTVWRYSSIILALVLCGAISVDAMVAPLGPWLEYLVSGGFGAILLTMMVQLYTTKTAPNPDREKFIATVNQIEELVFERGAVTISWLDVKSGWTNLLRSVRLANEADRLTELIVEGVLTTNSGESEVSSTVEVNPPAYTEEEDDALPSYDSVHRFTPPEELPHSEDIVPDVEYLTTPVGDWRKFSAREWEAGLAYTNPTIISPDPICDTSCTGAHILLLLEKHVQYTALQLSCVKNLHKWRALVDRSDWRALARYAEMLKNAITFNYKLPPAVPGTDYSRDSLLRPSEDRSYFPDFVPSEGLFEIKLRIHLNRRESLFGLVPETTAQLLSRLISTDFPMISSVSMKDDTITCKLFREVTITILSVPDPGFKLATKAQIVLSRDMVLVINSESPEGESVKFGPPYPVGRKSAFLSVDVKGFEVVKNSEGVVKLQAAGATVELEKVLATLSDLHWQ